jgi:hypothetical protein
MNASRRIGPSRWAITGGHTGTMKRYLSALQVAELAELLEDLPHRVGVVDEVLQAAAEGRGMTLRLKEPEGEVATTSRRSEGS